MKLKAVSGMMLILFVISMLALAFNIQRVKAEPVTITVIGPWAGEEMDTFLSILQAFENQTGINVNYDTLTGWDLASILPAQFAAGTTPGDVIFMWPWWIAEKAQEGHILEVTDLIDEGDFLNGTFDPVKVSDKIYGGAWTGSAKPGFWYRKSFFTANGLTEPTTWAEFLALLDDIAAVVPTGVPIVTGDGLGWPLTDIVEHFLITFGGSQLHRDLLAGTVDWNSTEVRSIFADYLVPLLQGNFSDPIDWILAVDTWWAGDYGLYFMGSWITGMVDDPDDLGVIPLPNCTGFVFSADYFFIPTYTQHLEEAKELFKFLASEEAQGLKTAQGGNIATNINVPLDAYPPVDREVAELVVGKEILSDLDDSIGGEFQTTFWDQLKLLWVTPGELDNVLAVIQAASPSAPPPPAPPVAKFTYSPESPLVGETVTFDASSSEDLDGVIVSYFWDFGDETNATGVTTAHAYADDGIYMVTLTVTDNDELTDTTATIVTVSPLPVRMLTIKLSGEHDYLYMENVKVRVAALVTDAETMEPISDANVTIEVYDPEGDLWISDNMAEKLSGRGIYEWESAKTIRQLLWRRQLSKGVYLVYVQASYKGGPTATDILEFHIDPPQEQPIELEIVLLVTVTAIVGIIASVWYVDHRRLSRKL